MRRMEEQAQADAANRIREIRESARRNAEREAKKIVALAVQRIAAEHTAETTVSAVALPNDEMKGRIIGREGRNIRAFELATGVDVIIDDTPDTVVVSCFDPVRREVARLALEKLVADGRIHPGRIEEVVTKARQEVGQADPRDRRGRPRTRSASPDCIRRSSSSIGRMRWRTSYGQNILQHSKEVAWLAGIMAAELGLDVAMAKRGALLHDMGKVLTHEHEGTHVQLGVEVATRYGEHPLVVNAIAAHHDDVPHESEISVLVQAADAISGSRPGARREAFETYVKRLEGLEKIASSYRGVEKVFAIQAGREVRIVVTPERRGRRAHGGALRGDRAPHRGGAAVSRADQGGRHPRDAGGGLCALRSRRPMRPCRTTAGRASSTARRSRAAVRARRRAGGGDAAGGARADAGLTVVLVGDDPASAVYVRNKEKAVDRGGHARRDDPHAARRRRRTSCSRSSTG